MSRHKQKRPVASPDLESERRKLAVESAVLNCRVRNCRYTGTLASRMSYYAGYLIAESEIKRIFAQIQAQIQAAQETTIA